MSELRDILSAADHKTLVLGDELCAGTESTSAEALVASGIQWLSNQSAKFMFATHLHHLSTLLAPQLDTLGLKIFHLHVDYDPVTKKLIYDRSLRPGSGTSLYGLEVARAMDLPLAFIDMALENRRKITGSTTQEQATPSTWNTSLVRKSCEMCQTNITTNLEVHHITPRALANKDGILPNGTHMNTGSNLIVLCQACHDKHHAGNLVITPLVQTSDGPERMSVSPTSSVTTRSSKWSEEQLDQIRAFLQQYKTMTLKVIQFQLKQQYDIDISVQMLGKIRREN
jgi:DNA mismatch repair protein MutS